MTNNEDGIRTKPNMGYIITKWIILSLIGFIEFWATVLLLLSPQRILPTSPAEPEPAWLVEQIKEWVNLEVGTLVAELKAEREFLRQKEQFLKELETRIMAEQAELSYLTQTIAKLQQNINTIITSIQQDEVANLKRLAKMYTAMEPAAAADILIAFPDDLLVKVLASMREDQIAPILEAMLQKNPEARTRIAELTDRIRLVRNTIQSESSRYGR